MLAATSAARPLRERTDLRPTPDAVVVSSDPALVDALAVAGRTVVVAASHEAFRSAMSNGRAREVLVVVDARGREHALTSVCRDPELLRGRVVVIRGGRVSERDRAVLAGADSVIWCSGALPARTLVRLAHLHR